MPYEKSDDFRRKILEILEALGNASAYDIFKEITKGIKNTFEEHNKLRVRVSYHLKVLEKMGKVKFVTEKKSNAPMKKKIYRVVK